MLPATRFAFKLDRVKLQKYHNYLKVLALVVLFSFLWGAWWGFYRVEKSNPASQLRDSVRVLVIKNYLPASFVAEFERENKIKLLITEKESDLDILREALSRNENYDLILIRSFIAKSFIIDNILTPLFDDNGNHLLRNLTQISVDFKNIDYDPDNKYLIPITWGLNGFVVNAQKVILREETLDEIFANKALSVFQSPVELFHLSTKLKPIIKNWVETGQSAELARDLKEFKGVFNRFSNNPAALIENGTLDIGQITNGQVARLIEKNPALRFVLPKDRSTLWIYHLAVSRGAVDVENAIFVLNELLEPRWSQKLVALNEQATVLDSLNESPLPNLMKSRYIRQVQLSRVELFINHEALEPLWTTAIDEYIQKSK
jgi:spermidine/putrescine transport system substrate-binding protein